LSGPNEKALEAARKAIHGGNGCTCRAGAKGDALAALDAACDLALGDDAYVRIGDVAHWLDENYGTPDADEFLDAHRNGAL
jgi:hypothetical protein